MHICSYHFSRSNYRNHRENDAPTSNHRGAPPQITRNGQPARESDKRGAPVNVRRLQHKCLWTFVCRYQRHPRRSMTRRQPAKLPAPIVPVPCDFSAGDSNNGVTCAPPRTATDEHMAAPDTGMTYFELLLICIEYIYTLVSVSNYLLTWRCDERSV